MAKMKKMVPRQMAVTFTDTSHVEYGGGDAIRRTVIIDLTEEQQSKMETAGSYPHRYEEITMITIVDRPDNIVEY